MCRGPVRASTPRLGAGLYFTIDPTSITNNMANPANCSKHGTCNYRGSDLYVVGGREGFGGVSESGPGGYPTSTEVAWMVSELERRNLSSHVAQMFLHDDEIGDSAAVKDVLSWLRKHAPHITGSTNTFSDSGPESLYASRNNIFSPEQYAITDPYQEWKSGQVGRVKTTACPGLTRWVEFSPMACVAARLHGPRHGQPAADHVRERSAAHRASASTAHFLPSTLVPPSPFPLLFLYA